MIDKKHRKMYVGGDSCAGNPSQYTAYEIANPKVFAKKEYLIGYTTSFRMGQILERFLEPPPIKDGDNLYHLMIDKFVPQIIKIFKRHRWSKNEDGNEVGGQFIVGVRGRLFFIESDFSVIEYNSAFISCGCGVDYAEGSLFNDTRSKDAILRAFKAAAHFSVYVQPPFKILSRSY